MDQFNQLLQKASRSSFYMMLLNMGLWKKIPFNKPHGFRITKILEHGFEITMPYKRNNLNHIKGLHACGLATLSEYVAGLTLLRKIGAKDYRLIMESLQMKYFYQAKMEVSVQFELDDAWVEEHVKKPLQTQDAVMVDLSVNVYDAQKNHICTGTTRWQVKRWDKVRTKV
jgi:acyl-coenzyme A thioesterase PaaI-like protein